MEISSRRDGQKDEILFPLLEYNEDQIIYDAMLDINDAFCKELERQDIVEERGVTEYIKREAPFNVQTFSELKEHFEKRTQMTF